MFAADLLSYLRQARVRITYDNLAALYRHADVLQQEHDEHSAELAEMLRRAWPSWKLSARLAGAGR